MLHDIQINIHTNRTRKVSLSYVTSILISIRVGTSHVISILIFIRLGRGHNIDVFLRFELEITG